MRKSMGRVQMPVKMFKRKQVHWEAMGRSVGRGRGVLVEEEGLRGVDANVCTAIEWLCICIRAERDYTEGWAEILRGFKKRVNARDTMRQGGAFMFTNEGEGGGGGGGGGGEEERGRRPCPGAGEERRRGEYLVHHDENGLRLLC